MAKANTDLVEFIKEARSRGFDDYEIRKPLIDKGWDYHEVERAFNSLREPVKYKNKISVYIDSDVLDVIEKRAKKNMLSISEQIEDIVRRSAVNAKKSKQTNEKLDDMLISLFSRRRK